MEAARLLLEGDVASTADVLAQIPSMLDEADARVLTAQANTGGSAAQFERALDIYRQLGATARIAPAEALLAGAEVCAG